MKIKLIEDFDSRHTAYFYKLDEEKLEDFLNKLESLCIENNLEYSGINTYKKLFYLDIMKKPESALQLGFDSSNKNTNKIINFLDTNYYIGAKYQFQMFNGNILSMIEIPFKINFK